MTKSIFYFLCILSLCTLTLSCVDEYTDANPPLPLDAPGSFVTVVEDTLTGGESTAFTLNIVDAPGIIDSIAYSTTGDKGTVVFDQASYDAAIGKTSAIVTGTFTAPTNASGSFDLSFEVFDRQGDQQSLSARKVLRIVYRFGLPSNTLRGFTATNSQVSSGNSTPIKLDFVIPGGFKSLKVFPSIGSVTLDQSSIDAAIGEDTVSITGIFTAPSLPSANSGAVSFIVIVEDSQERTRTFNVAGNRITVVYPKAVPSISIEGPSNLFVGNPGDFSLSVNAPGTIKEITIEAFRSGTNEEITGLTFSEEELLSLIGTTGGMVDIKFLNSEYIGYVDIRITILDEQGASVITNRQFLNQACTSAYDVNISGAYTASSEGTSTDSCAGEETYTATNAVSITKSSKNTFLISDLSGAMYTAWYGECYDYSGDLPATITISCGVVSVVPFDEPYGEQITGSGFYNADANELIITWENGYGDSATTVFSM